MEQMVVYSRGKNKDRDPEGRGFRSFRGGVIAIFAVMLALVLIGYMTSRYRDHSMFGALAETEDQDIKEVLKDATKKDPKVWKIVDCKVNGVEATCAEFTNPDDGIIILLAKKAEKVVFIIPQELARTDGTKLDLRFKAARVGVWFGDDPVETAPIHALQFSESRKALLFKDYSYFVRRASGVKTFTLGFEGYLNGQLIDGVLTTEFTLPAIPPEFMPDEGKGYGKNGFGKGVLVDERRVEGTRILNRLSAEGAAW